VHAGTRNIDLAAKKATVVLQRPRSCYRKINQDCLSEAKNFCGIIVGIMMDYNAQIKEWCSGAVSPFFEDRRNQ
jgi:hypothetical protein